MDWIVSMAICQFLPIPINKIIFERERKKSRRKSFLPRLVFIQSACHCMDVQIESQQFFFFYRKLCRNCSNAPIDRPRFALFEIKKYQSSEIERERRHGQWKKENLQVKRCPGKIEKIYKKKKLTGTSTQKKKGLESSIDEKQRKTAKCIFYSKLFALCIRFYLFCHLALIIFILHSWISFLTIATALILISNIEMQPQLSEVTELLAQRKVFLYFMNKDGIIFELVFFKHLLPTFII